MELSFLGLRSNSDISALRKRKVLKLFVLEFLTNLQTLYWLLISCLDFKKKTFSERPPFNCIHVINYYSIHAPQKILEFD